MISGGSMYLVSLTAGMRNLIYFDLSNFTVGYTNIYLAYMPFQNGMYLHLRL